MIAMAAIVRYLFAVIALAGYVANGAQTHLQFHPGESLSIQMCGGGPARTITMEIKGEPAEQTKDTCCGDCLTVHALPATAPALTHASIRHAIALTRPRVFQITPRSPLWPGAPPQGPPTHFTA